MSFKMEDIDRAALWLLFGEVLVVHMEVVGFGGGVLWAAAIGCVMIGFGFVVRALLDVVDEFDAPMPEDDDISTGGEE